MNSSKCGCVFPSPTEQELATVPGREPGTALRIYVEPGDGGYVRLQQLAYDGGAGWYVQKSFVIPGDMLYALVPELRKAGCLIPKGQQGAGNRSIPFMRLVSADEEKPTVQRRRA